MTTKNATASSRSIQFCFIAAILTVGFLFVLIRLSVIQWLEHGKWNQLAKKQHERTLLDHVDRGVVYDRNRKVLAINVDVPSLYAVSDKIKQPKKTARQLAPFLNSSPRALVAKLNREKDFIWLARKIDQDRLNKINRLDLPGIGVLMESKRFYPKRALFGHLVGFVGMDNNGLEGIEHRYDALLKGKSGGIVVVRDAHGKSIYPKGFNYIPPSQGESLVLTVDETIQHISTREIRRVVEKTSAKGGIAIVMNPTNGEILAMSVYPFFNPNTVGSYQPAQWRNRAITDIYEPGSTFKIITAAAALEEKVVSPQEMINCEKGTFVVFDTVIHDHEPMGMAPFNEVVARSSNIGMIKVATRLGKKRLDHYSRAFGFGTRRGIDLTGESPGLLRTPESWSDRSLASIAIGQEIGVTALQMILATAVIANNGLPVTPHVMLAKTAREEDTPKPAQPKTKMAQIGGVGETEIALDEPLDGQKRIISEETAKAVTKILEQVVTAGTGKKAGIFGFRVAGKTGTAQKIDPKSGLYSKSGYVSSFVGFVPADRPALVILVMIDEPLGEETGGEIAAPIFSEIGRETLRYLKVAPDVFIGSKGAPRV
ncbi:MAG: penicillin-binding protein 2 [Nitrospirota bacterium]